MTKLITIFVLTAWLASAAEKAPKVPDPQATASVKVHISLGDLSRASPSMSKLFNFDLPVKTAWTLRKTVAVIETELKRFEEQRTALIKKYGRQENGAFAVPPESMAAFSDDFKALSEITIDLNIEPISLSLFGDGVKLSASDMVRLEMFLIP